MPGVELTFGAIVAAIPFGIRAVGAVIEARRQLNVKEELLESLNTKVQNKLLLMAASMDVDGSRTGSELATLLDKAAHHIGIATAGKFTVNSKEAIRLWSTTLRCILAFLLNACRF